MCSWGFQSEFWWILSHKLSIFREITIFWTKFRKHLLILPHFSKKGNFRRNPHGNFTCVPTCITVLFDFSKPPTCPLHTGLNEVNADVAERAGKEARDIFLKENPNIEQKPKMDDHHVEQLVERHSLIDGEDIAIGQVDNGNGN